MSERIAEIWRDKFTPEELEVFASSGHGDDMGSPAPIAIVVVDVNHHFAGDRPEPILESIKRWPYSCGEAGWEAASNIESVLQVGRESGVPIVYTTGVPPNVRSIGPGRWKEKGSRSLMTDDTLAAGQEILRSIAPQEGDTVLEKEKPSAFFGTALTSFLIDKRIRSLLVCGATTSGCVRATVVDAFSLNFYVAVVAEATFDRSQTSHAVSLFDMSQKYCDVIDVTEAKHRIAQASER